MNHADQAMVDAWILMHLAPQGSERYLQNFWAFDALSRLCDTAPLQCLKVIDQICKANAGDVILSNLAAGPLEDVLTKHGELVIEKIVQFAKADFIWRKMLGAVWRNEMPDRIWKQVESVADRPW